MPFIDQTNDRKWHKAEVALQLPELPLVPRLGHYLLQTRALTMHWLVRGLRL